MEHFVRYNFDVSERLEPFFAVDKFWSVDPRGALSDSNKNNHRCDKTTGSSVVGSLDTKSFLKILFSVLPREDNIANIVGWSCSYLVKLAEQGDWVGLVDLTNYVFKSLMISPPELPVILSERVIRVMHELHYQANCEIWKIRHSSANYYDFSDLIDNHLNELNLRQIPKVITFVFLTEKYYDNFLIWLDLYLRFDPSGGKLLILAIGDGLSTRINAALSERSSTNGTVLNFVSSRKFGACGNGTDLWFLWYLKIHVVAGLVKRGISVIYSDLDAYWLKNYYTMRDNFINSSKVDIIFSPTGDMPRSAVLEWGFTPCAGFFSVEATPGGVSLMHEWQRMTEIMFDDQISAAELFFRNSIIWRQTDIPGGFLESTLSCGGGTEASLLVLSPSVARRLNDPSTESFAEMTIWHPRWVINSQRQKEILANLCLRPKID